MARRNRRDMPPEGVEQLSAQPLDLTKPQDATYMRATTAAARQASSRPWHWYDTISEIHYAVGRSARIAGYANLFAVERNPDGTPGKKTDRGIVGDITDLIQSPYGGSRGFVERFFVLLKTSGDAYLIRCRDTEGNHIGYDWIGAEEIKQDPSLSPTSRQKVFKANQKIERIVMPGALNGGTELTIPVEARDFVGRVWRPSGRFVFLPDTALRSLDSTCEELDLLTRSIKARLLSRFALNGIFFVPSEITQVRGGDPSGKQGAQVHDNKTLDRLIQAATWAVQNHEQPEAAVPIFMSGPGNYGDMIKHITYDRQIFEVDMKLRAELVTKILRGLDNVPTAVTGSQDSSHWNAWSASDEELRVDVKPDIEMMCWATTKMVLHREMLDAGRTPSAINKTMIWYDLAGAQGKTNIAEDVRQLRDRALVGDVASRRLTGLNETDAPTNEEYIRMVGLKAGDPYLATYGLPEAASFDWDKIGSKKTGPNPDSPADDKTVGPGVGNPGSPDDNKSDTPRRKRPA